MIEIEVEIDAELPAAEVQGIAEQIERLEEVAEMQVRSPLQERNLPHPVDTAGVYGMGMFVSVSCSDPPRCEWSMGRHLGCAASSLHMSSRVWDAPDLNT